jgi:hypothetical protein
MEGKCEGHPPAKTQDNTPVCLLGIKVSTHHQSHRFYLVALRTGIRRAKTKKWISFKPALTHINDVKEKEIK